MVPRESPFAALGLGAELLSAVERSGYVTPTAVQRLVIPAVLAERDVAACAERGSGKTAAFGLPWLQLLAASPRRATGRGNFAAVLVLAPARELVIQISEALARFAEQSDLRSKVLAVYGGVKLNPQMMALRGG